MERLGIHVVVDLRRIRFGRRLAEMDGFLNLRLHAAIDLVQLARRSECGLGDEQLAQGGDRAALFPRVEFLFAAITSRGRVAFVVAAPAVGERFDQRRPFAGACPRHGLAGRLPDREHVVAVDRDPGTAEGGGLAGNARVGGGLGQGRLRCIEVVLAHEKHRQLLHGGEIDRFQEPGVVRMRHRRRTRRTPGRSRGPWR